ncbi:MAG: nucleotide exchange factor GrpE [Methanocellales archaeon]|nr:nucleotide exchange factor GrpE [Methanocellales archaeon]MDD3420796.1 nucleotide exchange factor GrpE [Methanocellales archaeon]MDD4898644.1 nucleotide exchange factor GrpE [Methanocellales archaeon]MDD5447341.1 nucleotide exchange factor GrpE [Methanocellales archaeon]
MTQKHTKSMEKESNHQDVPSLKVSRTKDEKPKKKLEEEIKVLEKELRDKNELAQEYLKRLQYLQADFENYKKKVLKERDEFSKYANEKLIIKLLDVLDNLERALSSAKNSGGKKPLVKGVEMILKQLQGLLEWEGVTPIKALGEGFDPHKHEAVMSVTTGKYPENAVVEELQKGYSLKSKVIRPALVKVEKR